MEEDLIELDETLYSLVIALLSCCLSLIIGCIFYINTLSVALFFVWFVITLVLLMFFVSLFLELKEEEECQDI